MRGGKLLECFTSIDITRRNRAAKRELIRESLDLNDLQPRAQVASGGKRRDHVIAQGVIEKSRNAGFRVARLMQNAAPQHRVLSIGQDELQKGNVG